MTPVNRSEPTQPAPTGSAWNLAALLASAHLIALGTTEMVPETTIEDVLGTVHSVRAARGSAESILSVLAQFEERVEAQVPASALGVLAVGRGTGEAVAALARLQARSELLDLAEAAVSTRICFAEMADRHVVTMMAATLHGQPASPTSLGHWLGGTIGPLARANELLALAYTQTNRSPLGAGSLAAGRLQVDRDEVANLLAFDGVITNTFDAVSSVDFLVVAADAIEATVSPLLRFADELENWTRSDPDYLLFQEEQFHRFGDLPQLRLPSVLAAARASATESLDFCDALRRWARTRDYGPQIRIDGGTERLSGAIGSATQLLEQVSDLIRTGLEVNRAALANKAGKGYVTSSDLADFLILEESIAPADARMIAVRALSAIKERGQQISALDRDAIDGAALMVIGREIGIEIESLSRYLAPRRVVESRTTSGAPSPASTRAWIVAEQDQIASDSQAWETKRQRVGEAIASLIDAAAIAADSRLTREN